MVDRALSGLDSPRDGVLSRGGLHTGRRERSWDLFSTEPTLEGSWGSSGLVF